MSDIYEHYYCIATYYGHLDKRKLEAAFNLLPEGVWLTVGYDGVFEFTHSRIVDKSLVRTKTRLVDSPEKREVEKELATWKHYATAKERRVTYSYTLMAKAKEKIVELEKQLLLLPTEVYVESFEHGIHEEDTLLQKEWTGRLEKALNALE